MHVNTRVDVSGQMLHQMISSCMSMQRRPLHTPRCLLSHWGQWHHRAVTVHVASGPAKHRRHAEHPHVCAAAHFFSLDHPLIQELLRVPSELKRIHPAWDFFFFFLAVKLITARPDQVWAWRMPSSQCSGRPQSFHLNHYWPILLWWCLDLVLFFIPVWPGTYSRSSHSSLQALGLEL